MYDDSEFLDQLESERWAPAYYIAGQLDCTWRTVNRRLIQLAKDDVVEVMDPEADEYGIPENETTARPVICYRKVPDDRDPLTGPIED